MPCLHQPGLAPERKTGLILSVLTSWHYAGNWGLAAGQSTERSHQLRGRFAREMIASLEGYIPGLSGQVELCITGAPYNLRRRTSNYEGAIMGWSYEREKAFNRGSVFRIARSVETPIPNLLMAGHWAFSPGGSPVAVLTGKLAAKRILRETEAGRSCLPGKVGAQDEL